MRPLTFLSLFAGIGGFDLGLERAGMICKGQVEINDYCRKILEKHWPNVPRWGDIRTINPAELPAIDLICGGYPCQPFSQAGQRRGAADDRHLWPEAFRIIKGLRPRWLLFENVPGHITLGLTEVLSDLESQGYQWGLRCIPACALDAPHKRQRLWILAHAERPERRTGEPRGNVADRQTPEWEKTPGRLGTSSEDGKQRILANTSGAEFKRDQCGILRKQPGRASLARPKNLRQSNREASPNFAGSNHETFPNPNRSGLQAPGAEQQAARLKQYCGFLSNSNSNRNRLQNRLRRFRGRATKTTTLKRQAITVRWAIEPGVGRVVNGLPNRVDRIKALGNAVIPQIVTVLGLEIIAAEKEFYQE
jgi:DNA (cytosine-5)-methyltransferase 1